MSAKTKIVVLRMKEIIYTAIFIGLALFLVFLFLFMFRSGKDETSPTADSAPASYTPGIYSASIVLGNQNANVEVTVDADRITSVALIPLSETVETMYPLLTPALEDLELQLSLDVPLEDLKFTEGSTYTQTLLVKAIEQTLAKAEVAE